MMFPSSLIEYLPAGPIYPGISGDGFIIRLSGAVAVLEALDALIEALVGCRDHLLNLFEHIVFHRPPPCELAEV